MKVNENGFDPRLKEAIEKIKPILEEYDCMACMVLVSPTHSEYLNHLHASWSVMSFPPQENGGKLLLRFRSKKEDFPNKEIQDMCTRASAHALTTVIEWTRRTNEVYRSIVQQISKRMPIVWETWE